MESILKNISDRYQLSFRRRKDKGPGSCISFSGQVVAKAVEFNDVG